MDDEQKLIDALTDATTALNAAVENITSYDVSLSTTTLPRRATIGKPSRTIEQVTYTITKPIASFDVR